MGKWLKNFKKVKNEKYRKSHEERMIYYEWNIQQNIMMKFIDGNKSNKYIGRFNIFNLFNIYKILYEDSNTALNMHKHDKLNVYR